jgi:ribosomal protein S18 acetylase RimI-like enzyme
MVYGITEHVVDYQIIPIVTDRELNKLFAASWPSHQVVTFQPVLSSSMVCVCAFKGSELIGFVNAAWDGRAHAFILDTTVHPSYRRMGIGRQLVRNAVNEAKKRGVIWVHVDYEPQLKEFYNLCGFRPSEAGVINVASDA